MEWNHQKKKKKSKQTKNLIHKQINKNYLNPKEGWKGRKQKKEEMEQIERT